MNYNWIDLGCQDSHGTIMVYELDIFLPGDLGQAYGCYIVNLVQHL